MRNVPAMIGLCFGMLYLMSGGWAWTQEPPTISDSIAAYLPPDALGTVELAGLAPVLERIENSALLRRVLESPQWREALKQDALQKGLAGKALAESQLQMNLWQFAGTVFGDRTVVGVYAPAIAGKQPDFVLLCRVKEASALATIWDRLSPVLPLAGDKLKVSEHSGGGRLIQFEDATQLVIRDRWIVSSKHPELLEQTLLQLSRGNETSGGLGDTHAWAQMRSQLGTDHHVQLCLNMGRLNELVGHRLIPGKLDNPLLSVLFGGYLEYVAMSPYLGMTLDIADQGIDVRSTVAGDAKQLDAAHRPFLLDSNPVPQAEVPELNSPLNGFSLARDFASWYRNREALLEAALLPGFDKFETGLATFLAGRDFGEDVLPTLGQRLTLVTAPQTYPHLKGKPGVQLPAFGLLLDLAKPAEANDLLNLVFQTIVLVSNLQAAQEGREPFVLSSESYRETQIAFAKFVKQPEGENLPISYNFQPASARVGNRYVLATSLELCRELVDSLLSDTASPVPDQAAAAAGIRDVYFELSPTIAADLLKRNESVLHAQLLQHGKSAEQATEELNVLLELLRQLTPVTFSSVRHPDRWALELHVGWR